MSHRLRRRRALVGCEGLSHAGPPARRLSGASSPHVSGRHLVARPCEDGVVSQVGDLGVVEGPSSLHLRRRVDTDSQRTADQVAQTRGARVIAVGDGVQPRSKMVRHQKGDADSKRPPTCLNGQRSQRDVVDGKPAIRPESEITGDEIGVERTVLEPTKLAARGIPDERRDLTRLVAIANRRQVAATGCCGSDRGEGMNHKHRRSQCHPPHDDSLAPSRVDGNVLFRRGACPAHTSHTMPAIRARPRRAGGPFLWGATSRPSALEGDQNDSDQWRAAELSWPGQWDRLFHRAATTSPDTTLRRATAMPAARRSNASATAPPSSAPTT